MLLGHLRWIGEKYRSKYLTYEYGKTCNAKIIKMHVTTHYVSGHIKCMPRLMMCRANLSLHDTSCIVRETPLNRANRAAIASFGLTY